jgi:hypothetical protein
MSPDPTHTCECIIAVHISCDSRTTIVFVSEGSERVKTATLSFKLNQVLSDSSVMEGLRRRAGDTDSESTLFKRIRVSH